MKCDRCNTKKERYKEERKSQKRLNPYSKISRMDLAVFYMDMHLVVVIPKHVNQIQREQESRDTKRVC